VRLSGLIIPILSGKAIPIAIGISRTNKPVRLSGFWFISAAKTENK